MAKRTSRLSRSLKGEHDNAIRNIGVAVGGEESAGLSIKGHYPAKDGILACLLAAEAVAARGASLTEQLKDLYARVGNLEAGRIGIRLTPN